MKRQLQLLLIFLIISFSHALIAPAQAQDTLTIAMTGDIMMGTTFPSIMLPQNDGRDLFKDAKCILKSADLALGNLEGTLCNGGKSTKGNGPNSYSFRTPTSYSHLLKEAGFDYLSMANNHANDFGLEGIESTEHCLDSMGILPESESLHRGWQEFPSDFHVADVMHFSDFGRFRRQALPFVSWAPLPVLLPR